jgi:hypothetical protein
VDLDVGHLMLGIQMDRGDVGVGLELVLDCLPTLPAGEGAGRDGQGGETRLA